MDHEKKTEVGVMGTESVAGVLKWVECHTLVKAGRFPMPQ